MKKIIIAIALLFATAIIVWVSISAVKPNIDDLDPQTSYQIKQSYLEKMKLDEGYSSHMTIEDVSIVEYRGTYNGCVVIMLTDNETFYLQAIQEETVAGVKIMYSDSNKLWAWNKGTLYTLEDAYSEGLLKKSDIVKIAIL